MRFVPCNGPNVNTSGARGTSGGRGRGRGFTLVEVTVCLLIIAIVAAAATLRLRGLSSIASFEDGVDRIRQMDKRLRSASVRRGEAMRLRVELDAERLSLIRADDKIHGLPLQLPRGLDLAAVQIEDQRIDTGELVIACSAAGTTTNFALLLKGENEKRWLAVLGMTGQWMDANDETLRNRLLQASKGTWPDAD